MNRCQQCGGELGPNSHHTEDTMTGYCGWKVKARDALVTDVEGKPEVLCKVAKMLREAYETGRAAPKPEPEWENREYLEKRVCELEGELLDHQRALNELG